MDLSTIIIIIWLLFFLSILLIVVRDRMKKNKFNRLLEEKRSKLSQRIKA